MKKSALIALVIILSVFLVSGVLFACAPDTAEGVTAIEIVSLPDKAYFLVGSSLDLTGAEINILFESGQNRIYDAASIADRLTVSGFDSSERQLNQTVTIEFGGQSASFTVDIVTEDDIVDVTFDTKGGSAVASKKAVKNKPLSAYVQKPVPEKTDRLFNDWFIDGSSYAYDFSTVVTGNISLVAKWDVTVTFIVSGAGEDKRVVRRFPEGSSVSQEVLDVIYADCFAEKDGYDREFYKNYATDEAIPEGYFDNLTENKNVFCVYNPQRYHIYLQFNGATSVGGQGTDFPNWGVADFPMSENPEFPAADGWREIDVDFGDTVNLGRAVKYTSVDEYNYDFRFSGWFRDAEYTEEWENGVSTVDKKDLTLYARFMWSIQFFSGTDGTGVLAPAVAEPMYFDEGETVRYSDFPEIPEVVYTRENVAQYYPKEGYTGWWAGVRFHYKDEMVSTTTAIENQSKLGEVLTLEDILRATGIGTTSIYANYYRIPFTVYFEDFIDGTDEKLSGLRYGELINYARIPSKNELSFDRWFLDAELTTEFNRELHRTGGSANSEEFKQLGKIYKSGDEGFDPSVANGMSYGVMTLYAAYTANILFFKNGGNPDVNNSSTAIAELTQNVRLSFRERSDSLSGVENPAEWWRDREGVYYRYAGTATVPSIEPWQGREGFWYYGYDDGTPNMTRPQPADFDRIIRNENFVVYYAIVSYNVTYVAETSGYVEGFPGAEFSEVLADRTEKVTYDTTAPERGTEFYLDILAESPTGGKTTFTDAENIEWIIEGWYSDYNFRVRFDLASTRILNDTVIYAKWERAGTEGLEYNLIESGERRGTYAVSRGTVADEKIIVIPAKVNGIAVTTVDNGAFKGMTSLEKFYVTDSVVYVGGEAFKNSGLKDGNMPRFNSGVILEAAVFDGTDWLNSQKTAAEAAGSDFVIFNRNTLYLYVGAGGEVVLPDAITVVGAASFASAAAKTNVERVVIHNGVTAIRAEAFEGCSALREIVSRGGELFETSQLVSVGENAFYHLRSLENIVLSGDYFAAIDGVLYGMRNGEPVSLIVYPSQKRDEVFILPETVSQIDDNTAFYAVEYMRAFVFVRQSAPTIPEYLFNKNTSGAFGTFGNLEYILLPENDSYSADYSDVWRRVWADAADNIRYNAIDIDYVSPVDTDGTPYQTSAYYGGVINAYSPTAAYLTFGGWYLDEARTVPFTDETLVSWDIFGCGWNGSSTDETFKLYADWNGVLTFVVSETERFAFDVKAGEKLSGDALSVAETYLYEKDGYRVRWTYTEGGGYLEKSDGGFTVFRGGEVYVGETQIVYEVVFKSHFDNVSGEWADADYPVQNVPYGSAVALPSNPEPWDDALSFLVFGGWYSDEALTERWVNGVSVVRGDTVLYGRWLVPMTFVYEDYYTDEVEQYAQYLQNMTPPTVRAREGYSGVWVQRDGENAEIPANFTAVDAPRTYYAKYTINTYTVSFDVNGGSGSVASVSVEHGGSISAPEYNGTQNGGLFAGWFLDRNGTSYYNFGTPVTSDMTLYAQFATQLGGESFRFNSEEGSGSIAVYSVTARPENLIQSVVLIPSKAYDANNQIIQNSRITTIGAKAFYGCSSIRHLIISEYISELDETAFENMPNLEMISVASGNGSFVAEDGILYRIDASRNKTVVVKVPAKVKINSLTLPSTVTEIAPYAFEGVENIETVLMEAPYVNLGNLALKGIENSGMKFFVGSRDRYVAAADSPWRDYGDYVFSEYVGITYVDPFTGEEFSGDGYVSEIRVLTALTAPTATPQNIVSDGRTYAFGGWTTDAEGYNSYDFSTVVRRDLRLYARRTLAGTTDGLTYRLTDINGKRGYAVSIGSATASDIVIANFYNGLPVLAVAPNGFMQSSARSVYIPSTVERIYESSFIDMPNLETFIVDGRNKSFTVSDGALYSADMSVLAAYPAAASDRSEFTISGRTVNIWQYAFYGNKFLQSVYIGENVETIGYAAFSGSSSLTSVTINAAVPPEFTADPFFNCRSDLRVYVPGTKTEDFNEKSVAAKYRDKLIDSDAADKVYPLEARIFFIGSFDQATGGTLFTYQDVVVPGYATQLYDAPLRADAVFNGWFTQPYGGEEFVFTERVVNDDTVLYAHWKEATGENDEVPPKPYLEYLIVGDEASVRINRSAAGFDALTEIVIASEYTDGDGRTRYVTSIYENGFANLTKLKSVILPYTVSTIGKEAFAGCVALEQITLPGTIQRLGEGAFKGCSRLKSVELPIQIVDIPADLFADCILLSSVKIWGALTNVGERAFQNCASLASFDFGDSLANIGANAFENCYSLRRIYLPDSVKSIGDSAFKGSRSLEAVEFSEGATLEENIGQSAFANCENLSSVRLPNGLTAVSDSTFINCVSLVEVLFTSDVSAVQANAFRNCKALVSFAKTDGSTVNIDFIYNDAFNGCSSLKEFTFGEGFSYVGASILANCTSLERVVFTGRIVPNTYFPSFLDDSLKALIYVPGTVQNVYLSSYRTKMPEYYDRIYPVQTRVTFRDGIGGEETVITDTHKIIEAPFDPQRDGYVFAGWRIYGTDDNWVFATDTVGENGVTLEARWVTAGTSGLEYRYANGIVTVYRGTLTENVENVVVSNYYYYQNRWLPVSRIGDGLLGGTHAKTLYIPETVTEIVYSAFLNNPYLTEITVAADNPNFASLDGVLYNKTYTRLLRYPSAKPDTSFDLRFSVEYIERAAFENLRNLGEFTSTNIRFPVYGGVLYASGTEADGTFNRVPVELIAYPSMRTETVLTIPATVESIRTYALTLCENSPLAEFAVENGNATYEAHDGVLYMRGDGKARTLVRMPTAYAYDRFKVNTNEEADWFVSEIANSAFRYASGLRAVTFDGATPVTLGDYAFDGSELYILVPSGSVATYRTAVGWSEYAERIIASQSMLTYDFNNGDALFRLTVDALEGYPSLERLVAENRFDAYRLPTLAYSSIVGWFNASDGTEVVFDRDGATGDESPDKSYFIYTDATIYIKWEVRENVSDGLVFRMMSDGSGYVLASGLTANVDESGAVIVPSYYEGLPVLEVADNAFANMTSLKRLVLPETVKTIGNNAFGGCVNLENLTILATEPPTVSKTDIDNLRRLVSQNGGSFYTYVRADRRTAYGRAESYGLATLNIRDVEATVRFMAEDGTTLIATQKVISAVGRATAIEAPEVEGKTFEGWYNGDTPYNFDEIVRPESSGSRTLVLTARYSDTN